LRHTLLAARRLIQQLENLFQTSNLAFGFVMMFFKGGAQLVRVGGLRHFRKRLINLLLGVIDVLQGIEEEGVQIFVSHEKSPGVGGLVSFNPNL
jgi:hypothetical protein